MTTISDYYPEGMSGCDSVGMSGNCGPDCYVYLEGRCTEPQEMLPRLNSEEYINHWELYPIDNNNFK